MPYDERTITRFWSRVNRLGTNDCWEWTAYRTADGHGQIKMCGKATHAHRAAYQMLVGEIGEGLVVRHTCDNPGCCNPAHLLLGTHEDNVRDRVARNRSARGVDNGRSKLDPDKVLEIKARLAAGETCYGIAKSYGVDPGSIRQIKNGKNWAWVE